MFSYQQNAVQGGCFQLFAMTSSQAKGYVQISHSGCNIFVTLGEEVAGLVPAAKERGIRTTGDTPRLHAPRLCHHPLCQTAGGIFFQVARFDSHRALRLFDAAPPSSLRLRRFGIEVSCFSSRDERFQEGPRPSASFCPDESNVQSGAPVFGKVRRLRQVLQLPGPERTECTLLLP